MEESGLAGEKVLRTAVDRVTNLLLGNVKFLRIGRDPIAIKLFMKSKWAHKRKHLRRIFVVVISSNWHSNNIPNCCMNWVSFFFFRFVVFLFSSCLLFLRALYPPLRTHSLGNICDALQKITYNQIDWFCLIWSESVFALVAIKSCNRRW